MANARNKHTGSPIVKVFEKYTATTRLDEDLFSRNEDGTLHFEDNGDGADVDWSCGELSRGDDDQIEYMDANHNIVPESDIELYDKNCPACRDQLGGAPVFDETLEKMCKPCRAIALENRDEDMSQCDVKITILRRVDPLRCVREAGHEGLHEMPPPYDMGELARAAHWRRPAEPA